MRPVVLLVEDQDLNRELVEQILEDTYEVVSRADGTTGLATAQELRPDLILLDLSLPGIDGWEVARRVRADERIADVPIVALTAHAMPGDREKALEAGCNAYLAKPLDEDLLLETLEGLLDNA